MGQYLHDHHRGSWIPRRVSLKGLNASHGTSRESHLAFEERHAYQSQNSALEPDSPYDRVTCPPRSCNDQGLEVRKEMYQQFKKRRQGHHLNPGGDLP